MKENLPDAEICNFYISLNIMMIAIRMLKLAGRVHMRNNKRRSQESLTFWRRIFFFQILAHPVFKM